MTATHDTRQESSLIAAVTTTVRVAGEATPAMHERLRRALASLPGVESVVDGPNGVGEGFVVRAGSLIELCAGIVEAAGLEQAEVSVTSGDLEVKLPPEQARPLLNGTAPRNEAQPPASRSNGPARSAPVAQPSKDVAPARPQTEPSVTVAGGRRYPIRRRRHGGTIAVASLAVVAVAAVAAVLVWRSRGSDTRPPAPQPAVTVPARILVVPRSLTSVCTMDGGARPCDQIGQALWEGKAEAWQALARLEGRPAPNAQQAFIEATRYRLEMSDPVARIDLAKSLRLPATFITEARLSRSPEGLDVQVQLANLGATPDDLGGARLLDDQGMTVLVLPAGATLATGSRCRLSATGPVDSPCPFTAVFGNRPAGAEITRLELRNRDDEVIDRLTIPGVP